MCLDCGCMQPDELHGDDRHLIMKDIVDAADASNKGAYQVAQNIRRTVEAVLEGSLESEAIGSGGNSGRSSGGAPD